MKWRLQVSLTVIVLGAALPARAEYGPSTLTVCNHGTTTAQVVMAANVTHLLYGYLIEGTLIAPGECKTVYAHSLASAYIGIAVMDSRGQWVSGTADTIPDLGTKQQNALQVLFQKPTPVLTRGAMYLCYRGDKTWYGIRHGGAFPSDCSGFHPDPADGSGPYMPLMTIFQFDPDPSVIFSDQFGTSMTGGEYFLNITPSASSHDVRASIGTKTGADAQNSAGNSGTGLCGAVSCWDLLWQAYQKSLRDGTASPLPRGTRPPEPTPAPPPTVTLGPDAFVGGVITAPGGSPTPRAPGNVVVPALKAQLVFGGEIQLTPDGWHNADGSGVPAWLLDFATGYPPTRAAHPQHSAADVAVSRHLEVVNYLLRDQSQACTEYRDSTKSETIASISSSHLEVDDYGVVQVNTTESSSSSAAADKVRRGAALANLDLAHASTEERGCFVLSIPCKEGGCARLTRSDLDRETSNLTFRVDSAALAASIVNALKAIAPLYPDGGLPDRR
jgi:hypothetical protein